MSREATILHADLDAFFASVEQRDDHRLRARPVIVGGGVVMAASYEARAFGVRSAMGGAQARRLCPQAIVVAPRFDAYVDASRAVFAIFDETSPVVERLSIDEAFIDVRGLEQISGSPLEIAMRLRARVRDQVGLALTIGIASTKLLAKVVSTAAKPDGLMLVAPGEELAFLHPLPVGRLWGVGTVTAGRLQEHGIVSVGDIARAGEETLIALLGPASGRYVHGASHNRDARRVRARRRRRTIGSQRALGRGARSAQEIDSVLVSLVDRVTRRLRATGQAGRTVVLRLRFDDFARASRSRTLVRATAATGPVLFTARRLLAAAWPLIERRGLTLVGITIAGLQRASAQLVLPIDRDDAVLDGVLDDVRERFGTTAITRAALLDGGEEVSAWLMPGDASQD